MAHPTGLPNKVCPRLRDSACWRSGEITQPRSHFFGQLLYCLSTNLGHFFTPLPPFCADVIYGGPPPSPSIFCPFINALLARWRGARSRSCSCSSRRDISQRDKCCSHFTAPMSMSSLQVVTGPPYMTSAQGGGSKIPQICGQTAYKLCGHGGTQKFGGSHI